MQDSGGEQLPLKAKSGSVLATERLLEAKGINAVQSKGRILSPHNTYYKQWTLGTTFWACVMAVVDPIHLAFATPDGLYPYDDFWAAMEYVTIIIFAADMALKFFVAYTDPKLGMVHEPKLIALNYCKFLFWVDLITALPVVGIVNEGAYNSGYSERVLLYLGLIRWINLARLYRVFGGFQYLDRKMVLGQVALTLLRTTALLCFVTHWMGCIFYFIARVEGFSADSWVGATEIMQESEPWQRYFLSLYFSFVIFTGFGDNTFYDHNFIESIFIVAYLLVCVVFNAYILGSITTVMVSDDERSNTYRERVDALDLFAEQKELPEALKELMREHLELLHHTEATSDKLILHKYPPTLRKKVLRHLYLDIVRKCYPFRGCKTRFLEDVIGMAHMEVFNPEVEVVLEGDVVQELYIIAEGIVYGARAASSASQQRKTAKLKSRSSKKSSSRYGSMNMSGSFKPGQREDSMQSMSNYGGDSMKSGASLEDGNGGSSAHLEGASFQEQHGGPRKGNDGAMLVDSKVETYTTSQCFGHFSFFTDGPCLQDYWTGSLSRVLILSKAQMNDLAVRHPKQVKLMLFNLKQQVEEKFRPAVANALAAQSKFLNADPTGSQTFFPPDGSVEIDPLSSKEADILQSALTGRASFSLPTVQQPLNRLKGLLPVDERCYIQYWQEARSMTMEYLSTQEQQNVFQIITAAAEADIATVKKLVAWGVSPGSMDYDRRTALMVAAHANNAPVVKYLLEVGAPPNDQDAFGVTAMYEAVRMGHSEVIEVLKEHDAKLGMDEGKMAGIVTEAVIAGDLPQLRALLNIGVEATWGDHDGRTPLHFAAFEGNNAAVEVLVEEGNACVDALDRFNRTPADYAGEAGNGTIAEYLEAVQQKGDRARWTETKWYLHWHSRSRPQMVAKGKQ